MGNNDKLFKTNQVQGFPYVRDGSASAGHGSREGSADTDMAAARGVATVMKTGATEGNPMVMRAQAMEVDHSMEKTKLRTVEGIVGSWCESLPTEHYEKNNL